VRVTAAGKKQVMVRLLLLGCAYLVAAGLAIALFVVHGSSAWGGGQTVYEANPGPVKMILIGSAVACAVATASVFWRVVHRSPKLGVAGLAVGALTGAVALLGMLTVGPFILPLAALLVVVALPMNTLAG
jgi:hypothetical protein